jgi:hypothetical protein
MTKDQETIDVGVIFDTTGSMSSVIAQVRRVAEQVSNKLFSSIPGIRIAIMGLGDYCDRGNTYVTKYQDLSDDPKKVASFIRSVGSTGGGDADEAYELALHEARNFSWQAGRQRALIVIGDAKPHEPGYRYGGETVTLDWRNEVKMLREMNVKIYSVQALAGWREDAESKFYKHMAKETDGYYLELNQFESVVDLLTAICFKQVSPEALQTWELEVQVGGRMNRGLSASFDTLVGRVSPSFKSAGHIRTPRGVTPDKAIPEGRFQTMMVDTDRINIQDLVRENGFTFQVGRCFYEFTKSEIIRPGREVLLFEKETGEVYPNSESRKMMGLPSSGEIRAHPRIVPDGMTAFIQSTSYTRKLVGGTRLLYELDLSR